MAKIDIANLSNMKFEYANISDSVGIGGKNEKNDVMLIQALFKILGQTDVAAQGFFGIPAKDLPEPTGDFCEKTRRAIWEFQLNVGHRLLSIDGKIYPASYQNRVIRNAFRAETRLMAITILNMEAMDSALMNFKVELKSAVKRVAPAIVFSN